MRRVYISIIAILGIFLTTGCEKSEQLQQLSKDAPVFTSSFEDYEFSGKTKTYVDDNVKLLWHKDDELSIFAGNSLNTKYKFDGETGSNSGNFSVVQSQTPQFGTGNSVSANYAVYPYSSDTKLGNDEKLQITFPSEQNYAENSFGKGANPMVAVTSGTNDYFLPFKNVGGYIVLKLYGKQITVKSIELKGNNGEKISGAASVVAEYGKAPQVAMAEENTSETIKLNCGEDGVLLSDSGTEPTTFWIVVPPVTFENGFTVTITDMSGCSITQKTENKVVIERNVVSSMEAVNVQLTENDIKPREKWALKELYTALGGDNWYNKGNWCSDKPVEQWYGVNVNDEGFVTSIDLKNNTLVGELPDVLGYFSKLESLNLGNDTDENGVIFYKNQISGKIPEAICDLVSLEELYLHQLDLQGRLPENFGKLVNLRKLDLNHNKLYGTIADDVFSNMTNLESLILSYNEFHGTILPKITHIISLKEVFLERNYFSGTIPKDIGNLENLERLWMWNNMFYGEIPTEVGNLKNLVGWDCGENRLTGTIPKSIGNLSKIEHLSFGSNKLTGGIPEQIGSLANLKFLYLDNNNELGGNIPDAIMTGCTNLEELNLMHCGLTGDIYGIEKLTKLKILRLQGNQLGGAALNEHAGIPVGICNLTTLEQLELHDNLFTGSIPANIGSLTNLKTLNLGGNALSGAIPAGICSLSNLTYLALGNMRRVDGNTGLTLEIPENIGNLTNLTHLYLDINNLEGPLPDISGMAALKVMRLSNNPNLGGEIKRSIYNRLETCEFKGTKITIVEDPKEQDPS